MGKRKSKTSKQKQAKAAAKSLKSRVVTKDHRMQVNPATTASPAAGKNKKGTSPKSGEDAEFRRQQASMQERHMAEVQQRNRMTKNKNERGKNSNNNASKKNISSLAFHAPTLVVDDAQKSTNQLMGEMAHKVQGWDGINSDQIQEQHTTSFPPNGQQQPISLKQVYQNSTILQQQKEEQRQQNQQKRNRFSLLQNDDDEDSDAEERSQEQQAPNPLFHFAPPSFAVPSSGGGTPGNDIDPDL